MIVCMLCMACKQTLFVIPAECDVSPKLVDSESNRASSTLTYHGNQERFECLFVREQNICEYTVWVPLSVLLGGDYAVIRRCEAIHHRALQDITELRSDLASETPAYWFRVWGVSDSSWKEHGEMTSSDIALTVIVFNGRLFSEGNTHPNSRRASALAKSRWLENGGLEISLALSPRTLRIGETCHVSIRVKNTSDKRIVLPHIFGSPVRLAHENVTGGFSEAVSDAHKGSCLATYAEILLPGCDYVINRDITIRGRLDNIDSSVLRSDGGECLLTVLDMGYYGIPTSCEPVSFVIEKGP